MHPSGHFFAWVINIVIKKIAAIINNILIKKTLITHIPLQGVPYPSKFTNGCSIIKEVSVRKKGFLSPKAMYSIQTTEE